jgi:hypothetical protein
MVKKVLYTCQTLLFTYSWGSYKNVMKGNFCWWPSTQRPMSKPTFQKEGHIFLVFLKRNGKGALQFEALDRPSVYIYFCKGFFLKTVFPLFCQWQPLGTSRGTHLETWEPFGNMMSTHWEHIGNNKKSLSTHPFKKKKTGPIMSACWAFPLAAWNFYVPKLFVTIFGLHEYPHYKLGVLINLLW